ncbi:MAG: hypothetical protein Q8P79_02715 [Nanoarchaeota archaeon]|nr:hypothetical protein [Nanoarchaeota archaeon]
MVSILVILGIAAVILVYIGFKWNNLRTRFAFFFILFGTLVLLFFIFLVATGSSFDFSSLGKITSSMRVYFLWIKGALGNVFEVTGRAIGLKGQYVEYIGNNLTG